MFLAMAGAMSTAELGLSLAEMIRQDKIHAISCTGANLEEDIYNLVAHDHYVRIPNWRDLTPEDEHELLSRHLNRVTDTCIPEEEAIRRIEDAILDEWTAADRGRRTLLPARVSLSHPAHGQAEAVLPDRPQELAGCWPRPRRTCPSLCRAGRIRPPATSMRRTVMTGNVKNVHTVRTGIEYMMALSDWYIEPTAQKQPLGFFQIGGGIAGDFPICVVPMLRQDMEMDEIPLWAYFCQISDSTTSYGSYSGRRAQREDHLGEAGHHHAQVHDRVRRHHRRPADLRLRPGGLNSDIDFERKGCGSNDLQPIFVGSRTEN